MQQHMALIQQHGVQRQPLSIDSCNTIQRSSPDQNRGPAPEPAPLEQRHGVAVPHRAARLVAAERSNPRLNGDGLFDTSRWVHGRPGRGRGAKRELRHRPHCARPLRRHEPRAPTSVPTRHSATYRGGFGLVAHVSLVIVTRASANQLRNANECAGGFACWLLGSHLVAIAATGLLSHTRTQAGASGPEVTARKRVY